MDLASHTGVGSKGFRDALRVRKRGRQMRMMKGKGRGKRQRILTGHWQLMNNPTFPVLPGLLLLID